MDQRLEAEWGRHRKAIRARLAEFAALREASAERLFPELAFCLCTPQSNGRRCGEAVERLQARGLLWEGSAEAVERVLSTHVRFHKTKAQRIVAARGVLTDGFLQELRRLPAAAARERLAAVKGLGYKEASHFLRNVGLGFELGILDRHVLRNLKTLAAVRLPKTLTKKQYLRIERAMKRCAEREGLALQELDLLLWAKEAGMVFK